jgi:2-polyprenyl-6-methoxyphenol hydroxylase-like FAD-dependent oxidoreductase
VWHLLPRALLLDMLERAARGQEPHAGSIRILTSSRLAELRREPAAAGTAARLAVEVERLGPGGSVSERTTLRPQLVVGCDGVNSQVRRTLAAWQAEDRAGGAAAGSSGSGPRDAAAGGSFSMRELPGPSTGLRFRMLMLPPNPSLRSGFVLHNDRNVAVRGVVPASRGQKGAPAGLAGLLHS